MNFAQVKMSTILNINKSQRWTRKAPKLMQICPFNSHTGPHLKIFTATVERGVHKETEWDLLEHGAVILVPPDEDLRDGADGLDEEISIVVRYGGVFCQNVVHVSDRGGVEDRG